MVSFGRFLLIVILTIVVIVFSVNPQSAPIVPDLTGMKPWSSALGYLRKQEGSISRSQIGQERGSVRLNTLKISHDNLPLSIIYNTGLD